MATIRSVDRRMRESFKRVRKDITDIEERQKEQYQLFSGKDDLILTKLDRAFSQMAQLGQSQDKQRAEDRAESARQMQRHLEKVSKDIENHEKQMGKALADMAKERQKLLESVTKELDNQELAWEKAFDTLREDIVKTREAIFPRGALEQKLARLNERINQITDAFNKREKLKDELRQIGKLTLRVDEIEDDYTSSKKLDKMSEGLDQRLSKLANRLSSMEGSIIDINGIKEEMHKEHEKEFSKQKDLDTTKKGLQQISDEIKALRAASVSTKELERVKENVSDLMAFESGMKRNEKDILKLKKTVERSAKDLESAQRAQKESIKLRSGLESIGDNLDAVEEHMNKRLTAAEKKLSRIISILEGMEKGQGLPGTGGAIASLKEISSSADRVSKKRPAENARLFGNGEKKARPAKISKKAGASGKKKAKGNVLKRSTDAIIDFFMEEEDLPDDAQGSKIQEQPDPGSIDDALSPQPAKEKNKKTNKKKGKKKSKKKSKKKKN